MKNENATDRQLQNRELKRIARALSRLADKAGPSAQREQVLLCLSLAANKLAGEQASEACEILQSCKMLPRPTPHQDWANPKVVDFFASVNGQYTAEAKARIIENAN